MWAARAPTPPAPGSGAGCGTWPCGDRPPRACGAAGPPPGAPRRSGSAEGARPGASGARPASWARWRRPGVCERRAEEPCTPAASRFPGARVSARGARRAASSACAPDLCGLMERRHRAARAGAGGTWGATGARDSVGTVSALQARSGASLLLKLFLAKSSPFSEEANFPDSPYYPGGCGLLCSWNVGPDAGKPPLILLSVCKALVSVFGIFVSVASVGDSQSSLLQRCARGNAHERDKSPFTSLFLPPRCL